MFIFLCAFQVHALEDIQYVVKYAKKILPPNPADITGLSVERSMLALQQEMADARERWVHLELHAYRPPAPEMS